MWLKSARVWCWCALDLKLETNLVPMRRSDRVSEELVHDMSLEIDVK